EPGEQLRASRTRLHMREVEDAHTGQRLAVLAEGLARRPREAVAVGFLLAHGFRTIGLRRRLARGELHDLARGFLRGRFGLSPGLGLRLLFCLRHLLLLSLSTV